MNSKLDDCLQRLDALSVRFDNFVKRRQAMARKDTGETEAFQKAMIHERANLGRPQKTLPSPQRDAELEKAYQLGYNNQRQNRGRRDRHPAFFDSEMISYYRSGWDDARDE